MAKKRLSILVAACFALPQQSASSVQCDVIQSADITSCSKLRHNRNVNTDSCSRKICAKQSFDALGEFSSQTAFLGAVQCIVSTLASDGGRQRCGCFYAGLGKCFKDTGHTIHSFGDSTMRQFSTAVNLVYSG